MKSFQGVTRALELPEGRAILPSFPATNGLTKIIKMPETDDEGETLLFATER